MPDLRHARFLARARYWLARFRLWPCEPCCPLGACATQCLAYGDPPGLHLDAAVAQLSPLSVVGWPGYLGGLALAGWAT